MERFFFQGVDGGEREAHSALGDADRRAHPMVLLFMHFGSGAQRDECRIGFDVVDQIVHLFGAVIDSHLFTDFFHASGYPGVF